MRTIVFKKKERWTKKEWVEAFFRESDTARLIDWAAFEIDEDSEELYEYFVDISLQALPLWLIKLCYYNTKVPLFARLQERTYERRLKWVVQNLLEIRGNSAITSMKYYRIVANDDWVHWFKAINKEDALEQYWEDKPETGYTLITSCLEYDNTDSIEEDERWNPTSIWFS